MQENSNNYTYFSDRLDALLVKLNINTSTLARKLGVSRTTIYDIKKEKIPISDKMWRKIRSLENEHNITHYKHSDTSDACVSETERESVYSSTKNLKTIIEAAVSAALSAQAQAYTGNKLEETLAELVKEIQALRKECASLKQQQNQHPPPNDGKKVAG